jgi:hypothetical protein
MNSSTLTQVGAPLRTEKHAHPIQNNLARTWRDEEKITATVLYCELIANAKDAGATYFHSWLDEKPSKRAIFFDNGSGLDRRIALDPGRIKESEGIGKFGFGLKSSGYRFGKLMSVLAQDLLERALCSVNWEEWMKGEPWNEEVYAVRTDDLAKLDLPFYPVNGQRKTFTQITISDFHSGWRWRDLLSDQLIPRLERIFRHAILDGMTIVINGKKLTAVKTPALDSEIKFDTDVISKRTAIKVLAGLIPDNVDFNGAKGFDVFYRGQEVLRGWVPKFMAKCALGDFHGELELLDYPECKDWRLTPHKDNFDKADREALEEILESDADLRALVKSLAEKTKVLLLDKTSARFSSFLLSKKMEYYRGKSEIGEVSTNGNGTFPGVAAQRTATNSHVKPKKRKFHGRAKSTHHDTSVPINLVTNVKELSVRKAKHVDNAINFIFEDLHGLPLKIERGVATIWPSLTVRINNTIPIGKTIQNDHEYRSGREFAIFILGRVVPYIVLLPSWQDLFPGIYKGIEDNPSDVMNAIQNDWLEAVLPELKSQNGDSE